ncbi:hypothetical protein CL622_07145 [archaeon]|nr:hypothetical protein [archaeon]
MPQVCIHLSEKELKEIDDYRKEWGIPRSRLLVRTFQAYARNYPHDVRAAKSFIEEISKILKDG